MHAPKLSTDLWILQEHMAHLEVLQPGINLTLESRNGTLDAPKMDDLGEQGHGGPNLVLSVDLFQQLYDTISIDLDIASAQFFNTDFQNREEICASTCETRRLVPVRSTGQSLGAPER